jgi:hypothetical protein
MTSMMNIMNNRIFALKADLNDSDQPLAVGAAHPWMPLTRGRRSPVDAPHPWTPLAREWRYMIRRRSASYWP